jgi:adenylate cyclase
VRVRFLPEDLLVQAPWDARLQDIADAAGADLTFGCRSGSCGTCRVRILAGLDHCSPMGPEERDYLLGVRAPEDHRLACQVRVRGPVAVAPLESSGMESPSEAQAAVTAQAPQRLLEYLGDQP